MSLKIVKQRNHLQLESQVSRTKKDLNPKQYVLHLENEVGYSDAARLDSIDEDSFLQNLKVRFLSKQIYTGVESTVIAINPYESLPLYSSEVIAAYEHHSLLALPPHIYSLCEYTLYCLKEHQTDQCILISGVSGSGKTECFKAALHYFINGSSERSELSQIKNRLNSIPIVLQALGNASTEHNSNSTRLVYMLELDFDFRGDPLGGQVTDFFLEKSRVAKHEIYGYNFHIFYQLVSGAGTNLMRFLKLKRNIDNYYLLKEHKQSEIILYNAQNQIEEFRKTKSSLHTLGFSSNEIVECLQTLAFILKLGNLQFLRKANIDSTEGCSVLNDFEIGEICDMFKLDESIFVKLLTQKIMKNQNEVFIAELSANAASKMRNTVCKALYFRLVSWIIARINELIKTKPSLNLVRNNLSIFDSFGFENYNINFLEQLFINYLHEKIEQIFVDIHFRQKQEDYLREDIGWENVDFSTNDLLCILIERPHHGILSTLEEDSSKSIYFREELFIKNLNHSCTKDLHYVEISNPVHMDSEGNGYFLYSFPYRRLSAGDVSKSVPQLCFAIRHFNETVVYSVNGFIEKNTDHIHRNWSHFLYQSDHPLLRMLFPEGNPVRKSPKKLISLVSQFCISIDTMLAKLQNKEIHFIKCVKPNAQKMPNIFEDEYVYRQLSSQFLIEHSDFASKGYFYSETYAMFFKRFSILSLQTWPVWSGSIVNGVFMLLHNVFNGNLSHFNFGRSKIFIKHLKTLMELEEYRLVKLNEIAIKVQKNIRKWLQVRKYQRMVTSQICIARFYRNWKRRMFLLWLARHLPSRSPLCRDWPLTSRSLKEVNHLLQRIYHKWRCHIYRLGFDQPNRSRMKEKVAAMRLFKGKKASYRNSVSHPFRGDYIHLRQNVRWRRLSSTLGEPYIVFADLVSKITKRCGKFVHKLLVVSTSSFLVLDHRTMQLNHCFQLSNIFKISTSPFMDNILVIHIYTDRQGLSSRTFIFESSHLIELITKLYLVVKNAVGRPPTIEVSHEFQVCTGKETLVLFFKSRGPPELSSKEVKISRKSNRLEFTT